MEETNGDQYHVRLSSISRKLTLSQICVVNKTTSVVDVSGSMTVAELITRIAEHERLPRSKSSVFHIHVNLFSRCMQEAFLADGWR